MWVIPKNLITSVYAPDMVESISDLNELSEMCERSLMWRSKHTRSKTWLTRLKRTCSTWRLFGRILKLSNGNDLVTEWIYSRAASLASHLVQPDEDKATKIQGICGRTSPTESNDFSDLPLFSLKTSKELSVQSSRAKIGATRKEHPFCFMSCEKWNDWVIVQRQAYSQRVKSEHRTQENESLFLVYEMTLNNPESKSLISLSNQDQVLKMHGQRDEVRNNLNLNQVEFWRTIQARNWKGSEGRSYKGLTEDLPKQTNPTNKKGIFLNPRWVEMLMGIPTGWTMATCVNPYIVELTNLSYSETESSRQPPTELLESFGENWLTPISVEYKEIGRSMESTQKMKQKRLTHQVCFSHWPTLPASQRGDTVAIYERKSKKRESKGLCRFAPTLQVAVLLEEEVK